MRALRCEHCGALASSAGHCRYCGTPLQNQDLIAAGFCDDAVTDAFVVLRDTSGVRLSHAGSMLRVDVPPETEVGPAVVGCACTRGNFVDLDVSVAIRFEHAARGIAAGIWLRSSKAGALRVMIAPDGAGSVMVNHGEEMLVLGRFQAVVPLVLRAKVVSDVLTVYRNGVPAISVSCPTDLVGGGDLVVEVPAEERGVVVFEDVCARL
jgi:hypothetical protein